MEVKNTQNMNTIVYYEHQTLILIFNQNKFTIFRWGGVTIYVKEDGHKNLIK